MGNTYEKRPEISGLTVYKRRLTAYKNTRLCAYGLCTSRKTIVYFAVLDVSNLNTNPIIDT